MMNATANVGTAQAKKLALTAPIACAVLAFVASISGEAPEIQMGRVLIGVVILMVLLSLMAEAAPSIAAGFAWLILTTAFFVTGEPAWTALSKLTASPSSQPAKSRGGIAAGIIR